MSLVNSLMSLLWQAEVFLLPAQVILLGAYAGYRSIGPVLDRGLKKRVSKDLIQLFTKILRAAIVVLGSVTALGTIGVDVTGLVASLGLGSFALAFALQDSLSNILSGVMILMYRPFAVGDVIKVLSFSGLVINIDLRYTYIQTEDEIAMIPNKTLFSSPVSKIVAKKSNK